MLVKSFSIEHARSRPDGIAAALHPGTVDTALSRPFQGRATRAKLFAPEVAADYLLQVIDNLEATDTGGFFAWDGAPIDY